MSGYRPDIDGLRAVAVLLVVFHHLHWSWFPSGYVGVDVFFVISGYLITGLLCREFEHSSIVAVGSGSSGLVGPSRSVSSSLIASRKKQFSLITFYLRRIKRILPALLMMLFLTGLLGIYYLRWNDLVDFGEGLAATLLFVSNWYWSSEAKELRRKSDVAWFRDGRFRKRDDSGEWRRELEEIDEFGEEMEDRVREMREEIADVFGGARREKGGIYGEYSFSGLDDNFSDSFSEPHNDNRRILAKTPDKSKNAVEGLSHTHNFDFSASWPEEYFFLPLLRQFFPTEETVLKLFYADPSHSFVNSIRSFISPFLTIDPLVDPLHEDAFSGGLSDGLFATSDDSDDSIIRKTRKSKNRLNVNKKDKNGEKSGYIKGKDTSHGALKLTVSPFEGEDASQGYFGHGTESRLLVHMWSLSVEEQFYMVWPASLFVIWGMTVLLFKGVGWLGGEVGGETENNGNNGQEQGGGMNVTKGGEMNRNPKNPNGAHDLGELELGKEPSEDNRINVKPNVTKSSNRSVAAFSSLPVPTRITLTAFTLSFLFGCAFLIRGYKMFHSEPSASRAYYECRSWEILSGAVLALFEAILELLKQTNPNASEKMMTQRREKKSSGAAKRLVANLMSFVGMFLMLKTAIFHPRPTEFDPDSFRDAILPAVVGAVLYIGAGGSWLNPVTPDYMPSVSSNVGKEDSRERRNQPLPNILLGGTIPVAIGFVSYPLYLYHWPLIGFANYFSVPIKGNWMVSMKIITLSVVMAIFSYKVIETPVRLAKSPNRFFVSRYFSGICRRIRCCFCPCLSRQRGTISNSISFFPHSEDIVSEHWHLQRLDFYHGWLTFWLLPLVFLSISMNVYIRHPTHVSFFGFWTNSFLHQPGSIEQLERANQAEFGFRVPVGVNGTNGTNGTGTTSVVGNDGENSANANADGTKPGQPAHQQIDWQHGTGMVDKAKASKNQYEFFMEQLKKGREKKKPPKGGVAGGVAWEFVTNKEIPKGDVAVVGGKFHGPVAHPRGLMFHGSVDPRFDHRHLAHRGFPRRLEEKPFTPEDHIREISPLFSLSASQGFRWVADHELRISSRFSDGAVAVADMDSSNSITHTNLNHLPFAGFGSFLHGIVVKWGKESTTTMFHGVENRSFNTRESWFLSPWSGMYFGLTNLLRIWASDIPSLSVLGSAGGDNTNDAMYASRSFSLLLKRQVLVLGDSHLWNVLPVLDVALRKEFLQGWYLVRAGAPFLIRSLESESTTSSVSDTTLPWRNKWLKKGEAVSEKLKLFLVEAFQKHNLQFDIVVIAGFWTGYLSEKGRLYYDEIEADKIKTSFFRTLTFLLEAVGVKKIVLVRDVPSPSVFKLGAWCGFMKRDLMNKEDCVFSEEDMDDFYQVEEELFGNAVEKFGVEKIVIWDPYRESELGVIGENGRGTPMQTRATWGIAGESWGKGKSCLEKGLVEGIVKQNPLQLPLYVDGDHLSSYGALELAQRYHGRDGATNPFSLSNNLSPRTVQASGSTPTCNGISLPIARQWKGRVLSVCVKTNQGSPPYASSPSGSVLKGELKIRFNLSKCEQPYFRARLSGAQLVSEFGWVYSREENSVIGDVGVEQPVFLPLMIVDMERNTREDWAVEKNRTKSGSNSIGTFYGTFVLHEDGPYFLEVVVLSCASPVSTIEHAPGYGVDRVFGPVAKDMDAEAGMVHGHHDNENSKNLDQPWTWDQFTGPFGSVSGRGTCMYWPGEGSVLCPVAGGKPVFWKGEGKDLSSVLNVGESCGGDGTDGGSSSNASNQLQRNIEPYWSLRPGYLPSALTTRWQVGPGPCGGCYLMETRYENQKGVKKRTVSPLVVTAEYENAAEFGKFLSYEWKNGPDWLATYQNWLKKQRGETDSGGSGTNGNSGTKWIGIPRICVVGASHSKRLKLGMEDVVEKAQKNVKSGQTESPQIRFTFQYREAYAIKFRRLPWQPVEVPLGEFDDEEAAAKWRSEIKGLLEDNGFGKCSHIVLGFGQWPLSWARAPPLRPSEYVKDVVRMMEVLLDEVEGIGSEEGESRSRRSLPAGYNAPTNPISAAAIASKNHYPKIYFRSIHFNPLNTASLQCPMKDWRVPPNIDRYNQALHQIFQPGTANGNGRVSGGSGTLTGSAGDNPTFQRIRERIQFIDTNFIISPVWDSAGDGCHYEGAVRDAEAEFVLNEMFEEG